MKSNTNTIAVSARMYHPFRQHTLRFFIGALLLIGLQSLLHAQEYQYTKPSWWFGAAGAANMNFYRGSSQQFNPELSPPVAFHNGFGVGHYAAPLIEFQSPNSGWGFMLQVGHDSRKGTFDQVITPCNCPADLSTSLTYISVEPSLRLAPFNTGFYLYGGPRLAFNLEKSFRYQLGTNPAIPDQAVSPEVKGDWSDINKTLISMQIGAGYDIPLASQNVRFQSIFSPFIAFQPYFGQSPRSVETWNISTLRAGAALKFGLGRRNIAPAEVDLMDADVRFMVSSPQNIPVERRVRETFPLLNYVFFDLGSTEIPSGYVLLRKNQVKDFKEDQLEVFAPKTLAGRSQREMVVYYNILNILGDRMSKNPASSITLVGSSEKGPDDGKLMAESIKKYLVNIFDIDASRIAIEGGFKPKLPSEQPGGTRELELLRAGDRRVSIESRSSALLMEFQSGPAAPLKPVELNAVQTAPLDSYVTFTVEGGIEAISPWSLEITDKNGKTQYFGPYNRERVSLPGKAILGTQPEGDFKVTMKGKAQSGKQVKREAAVHMVLWTPPTNEQGMRYSVIFGFNESKTIGLYERYLTEIVMPKIPMGAIVIIHGYTDIIGDAAYNEKLSLARASEVRDILVSAMQKAGRNDVKFDVYGFGEDETLSPFENKFPEERFYNRTVLIDIFPRK